jgi:hypothetical protein
LTSYICLIIFRQIFRVSSKRPGACAAPGLFLTGMLLAIPSVRMGLRGDI